MTVQLRGYGLNDCREKRRRGKGQRLYWNRGVEAGKKKSTSERWSIETDHTTTPTFLNWHGKGKGETEISLGFIS